MSGGTSIRRTFVAVYVIFAARVAVTERPSSSEARDVALHSHDVSDRVAKAATGGGDRANETHDSRTRVGESCSSHANCDEGQYCLSCSRCLALIGKLNGVQMVSDSGLKDEFQCPGCPSSFDVAPNVCAAQKDCLELHGIDSIDGSCPQEGSCNAHSECLYGTGPQSEWQYCMSCDKCLSSEQSRSGAVECPGDRKISALSGCPSNKAGVCAKLVGESGENLCTENADFVGPGCPEKAHSDEPSHGDHSATMRFYHMRSDSQRHCEHEHLCTCADIDGHGEFFSPGVGIEACKKKCLADESCSMVYCEKSHTDHLEFDAASQHQSSHFKDTCSCHEYSARACESTHTPDNPGIHFRKVKHASGMKRAGHTEEQPAKVVVTETEHDELDSDPVVKEEHVLDAITQSNDDVSAHVD